MATEAEKQKQRVVQAAVDKIRRGRNGSETLQELMGQPGKIFNVSYRWRDADAKVMTGVASARIEQVRPLEWKIEVPAAVLKRAQSRLGNNDFLPSRNHSKKYIRDYVVRLERILSGRDVESSAAATLEANDAAIVFAAAWTSSGLLFNQLYTQFRVETDGVFVRIQQLKTAKGPIGPGPGPVGPKTESVMLADALNLSPNIVLEGVPGTGKTFAIKTIRGASLQVTSPFRELSSPQIRFMTMHPSTSYEDFVEGLRPSDGRQHAGRKPCRIALKRNGSEVEVDGSSVESGWFMRQSPPAHERFSVVDGFFVRACIEAADEPDHAFVVVLDELNRCNIPKVLGDLLTIIEESKRVHWGPNQKAWQVDDETNAVTLPYSGRKLFVPDNLFIVGTMNTTDRSVAPMDAALRRRFAFHRIWPQGFEVDGTAEAQEQKLSSDLADSLGLVQKEAIVHSLGLWRAINEKLKAGFGADAMLGHSYLYDLHTALEQTVEDGEALDASDAASDETTSNEADSIARAVASVVQYHWNHRILPQLMDVIESNGLTRALVKSPLEFFGEAVDSKVDNGTQTEVSVLKGGLTIRFSGAGGFRKPHFSYGSPKPVQPAADVASGPSVAPPAAATVGSGTSNP